MTETELAARAPAHGRVLIVEDDPAIARLLRGVLTTQGYQVDHAVDGEAALAAVASMHPDVILLDVGLPKLDGFEVCRRVKQNPATRLIPIVIVTGLSDRDNRLTAIEAGADDLLSKPFDQQELRARVGSLMRIKQITDELESAESVIRGLALTVEARDPRTEGHCRRLAQYATALGRAIGLDADAIAALDRGGYLHDVGKVGIPDAILLKPSRLTDDEFEIVKHHPVIGESLCGNLNSLTAVRPIVRSHHERLDGSGYPEGLRGDEIPVLAHIIGIVDSFDAMTTDRPYRPALSVTQASEDLARDVTVGRFHPSLTTRFLGLVQSGHVS